jgi:hypothetical protein
MCGRNYDGAMSSLPKGVYATPQKIPGVTNAVAAEAAGTVIVRLRDNTLVGWGYGVHGSLGDGYVDRVWPQPHAPIGVGQVLAHYYANNSGFAIKADGTVLAWGYYVGGDKEWALKPFAFYKVKLGQ